VVSFAVSFLEVQAKTRDIVLWVISGLYVVLLIGALIIVPQRKWLARYTKVGDEVEFTKQIQAKSEGSVFTKQIIFHFLFALVILFKSTVLLEENVGYLDDNFASHSKLALIIAGGGCAVLLSASFGLAFDQIPAGEHLLPLLIILFSSVGSLMWFFSPLNEIVTPISNLSTLLAYALFLGYLYSALLNDTNASENLGLYVLLPAGIIGGLLILPGMYFVDPLVTNFFYWMNLVFLVLPLFFCFAPLYHMRNCCGTYERY